MSNNNQTCNKLYNNLTLTWAILLHIILLLLIFADNISISCTFPYECGTLHKNYVLLCLCWFLFVVKVRQANTSSSTRATAGNSLNPHPEVKAHPPQLTSRTVGLWLGGWLRCLTCDILQLWIRPWGREATRCWTHRVWQNKWSGQRASRKTSKLLTGPSIVTLK